MCHAQVHMLKKNPGSGCAFVTFDRWASCEAAIAALHGEASACLRTGVAAAADMLWLTAQSAQLPVTHQTLQVASQHALSKGIT
jgi:hypothetical protein